MRGPQITLPTALYTANPEGSPQLVTPTQANGIATAMWQVRESALISGDTTALTQLEPPGLLLTGDLYSCAEQTDCGQRPTPRPIDSLIPVVPVQGTYPIYFLAEVETDVYVPPTAAQSQTQDALPETPGMELDILTKGSSSAPWQLSFETTYAGINGDEAPDMPFDFAGSPLGSGPPATASTPLSFNPAATNAPPVPQSQFISLLAAYWQSWKDVQGPPQGNAFADGAFTSQYGQDLGQYPQGTVFFSTFQHHRHSYSVHYSYTADPSQGTWPFSANRLPVTCGTTVASAVAAPSVRQVLVQNTDRTNWGVPLSPGRYSSITSEKSHRSCVFSGPGQQLTAIGNDGFEVAVTGATSQTVTDSL